MLNTIKRNLSPKQKAIILKWVHKFSDQSPKINRLVADTPAVSFTASEATFSVAADLSFDERLKVRSVLLKDLKEIPPTTSISLDAIRTGYYDRCLNRYLFEKYQQGLSNSQTCWFSRTQKSKVVAWSNPSTPFTQDEMKRVFKDKIESGKIAAPDEYFKGLSRDENGFVISTPEHVEISMESFEKLYHSMLNEGVSDALLRQPAIVLGHSTTTGQYNCISGRHRVATLLHLAAKGKISAKTRIPCHIVSYPYETIGMTRPIFTECKSCQWGSPFSTGKGHQNFSMHQGFAHIMTSAKEKGGAQKWALMEKHFSNAVKGKKFIDIGAYKGLYCLKALEYSATHSFALEISPDLVETMEEIKEKFVLDNFTILQNDFYNDKTLATLRDQKIHSASLLGIIHHLLRIGIQNGSLSSFDQLIARIAEFVSESVFIEFAIPTEKDLATPLLASHKAEFTEEKFVQALAKYYPHIQKTGKCNYKSGNQYGRYMYFASK